MAIADEADTIHLILDDIEAAVVNDDRLGAMRLAADALAKGIEEPLVLLLVAEQYAEEGAHARRLELLRKAAAIAPDEAEVWKRLGAALAQLDMHADALAALDTALKLEPDSYPTLVAAGLMSFRQGDLEAAQRYYGRAAELQPREAELVATLAVIAARLEKSGEARLLAQRALALRPDLINAHMAIARADLVEKNKDATVARTTDLLARTDLNDENRIGVLDLRADALDKMDLPARAFADYTTRNAILSRLYAPVVRSSASEGQLDRVRRLAAFFAGSAAAPWSTGAGDDGLGARTARRHVFLVGFPRSGTTLLEKALAGHPEIVTLAEIDHLGVAGNHLLASNAALRGLAELSAADADACRATYWNGVRNSLGDAVAGKIVVDKMPLHTPALPLVAKLFPEAKIIFALRDPRDVVFSCFRRRFRMNAAMYEFLSLGGAAEFYDQTMRLAALYRNLLPLEIHHIRHEDVVADFRSEVEKVFAFVGVDWDAAAVDFAARARARRGTPSDPQLARGLNAEGVGQWLRYEQQLAPVLPTLAPWVREFGYQLNSRPSADIRLGSDFGFRTRSSLPITSAQIYTRE